MGTAPKDASSHTRVANAPTPPHFDPADFERAAQGLIAQIPSGKIETPFGVVWDTNRYSFIEPGSENPATVHPSLWRQAQLNGVHGLFEVAPGIWQARGYDISNITFIAGDTGWVIIDPLTAEPCARACLDLANHHLGEWPVVAGIYTHSHTDHFGGVLGVTTQEDVDAGRCRIIAPLHFLRETLGENVIAGYSMIRRASTWIAASARRSRSGRQASSPPPRRSPRPAPSWWWTVCASCSRSPPRPRPRPR
jgi:alkyl sulfatase BDS1-like metallo-beta-lactamase superfamily hydrolase